MTDRMFLHCNSLYDLFFTPFKNYLVSVRGCLGGKIIQSRNIINKSLKNISLYIPIYNIGCCYCYCCFCVFNCAFFLQKTKQKIPQKARKTIQILCLNGLDLQLPTNCTISYFHNIGFYCKRAAQCILAKAFTILAFSMHI